MRTFVKPVLVASFLLLGLGTVMADTVMIISNPTDTITYVSAGSIPAGGAVAISVHPLWEPNHDGVGESGAVWISYADTGVSGTTLAPPSGESVVMTVQETFYAGAGSTLNLMVWTDDTSRVLIDGVEVFAPNFTQNICADGAIGCEPYEFGQIDFLFATSGMHTITFEAFQVGTGTTNASNPFGLLYEGTLTTVPEPAALVLLGVGMAMLASTRRKRRH